MTPESPHASSKLHLIVFSLVAASFTNIYITQPVLPVLQNEFHVDAVTASFSVAAVILGIALSNLPYGVLVDRVSIRPIILVGGLMVAAAGLVCAATENIWTLIAARFAQGLFIPALTTCLAAFLAQTLPADRLNIAMGSYVSATVVGGLGGRLLGGLIHPPLHWRYAFISAAILILIATLIAVFNLPKEHHSPSHHHEPLGFLALLKNAPIMRIFLTATGGFFIFSSLFNYLPFHLTGQPFNFSTEMITLLYLVYIMGIFMGPLSGRLANRFGSGNTLLMGSLIIAGSLLLALTHSVIAIVVALLGICGGFFTIHAAAVGSLNRRLKSGQGRANALYVLFYYVGGGVGITLSGIAYTHYGWSGVIALCALLLYFPIRCGFAERAEGT